jgi:hypothetical protein
VNLSWGQEFEEAKQEIEGAGTVKSVLASSTSDYVDKELILIYGQPKTGKTYAICSFVERTIIDGGNVFYINTDGGLYRTLKAYFGVKFDDIRRKINYYFITDLSNIDKIVSDIKSKVKPNDLVCVDLIDDFWDMAQGKFVEDASKVLGVSPVDYIIASSKEREKFGMLTAEKWQYCKKVDDFVTNALIINSNCNVVAACSAKDVDVSKIFAKRSEKQQYEISKFEEVGFRPGGQKRLHYKFHTVIYLGEKSDGKHFFIVMGDRGFNRNSKNTVYSDNFYESYMKTKKGDKSG